MYIYIILSSIPCNCLHDQRSLSYCVYVPIDVYIADGAFNCGFTIYLTRALQCICVGSVKDIVLRFLQRARMYSVFFSLCIYVGCRHICNKKSSFMLNAAVGAFLFIEVYMYIHKCFTN